VHAHVTVRVGSVAVRLRRESVGARLAVCAVGDRESARGDSGSDIVGSE